MELLEKFKALLTEVRGTIANQGVVAAIDAEIAGLEELAHRGVQVVEAHIANWVHGAYTTPDGAIASPVDQLNQLMDVPDAGQAAPVPDQPGPDTAGPVPVPLPL